MKTANLTGALLDYWVARAEGVPADQLEIRNAVRPGDPRSPDQFCVHTAPAIPGWMTRPQRPLNYSNNWALTGPLLEKHGLAVVGGIDMAWYCMPSSDEVYCGGEDPASAPLIAICRAVVRAAFGDEVEDLP